MEINLEKLKSVLKELADGVYGNWCDGSVFIGEIERKPVKLTVMSKNEAVEEHGYDGIKPQYECIQMNEA